MNLGRNDAEMKRRMNNGLLWLLAGLLLFAMPLQAAASEQGAGSGIPLSGVWQGDGAAAEVQPVLETDEAVEQFLLGSGDFSSRGRGIAAVDANGLKLVRKQITPGGRMHYTYQQTYQNIPVYGIYAQVKLDGERRLERVNNDLKLQIGLLSLDTQPALTAEQAIRRLLDDIRLETGWAIDQEQTLDGRSVFHADAELMVLPTGNAAVLAYRVELGYLFPQPGGWVGFVDADSGEVMDKYSRLMHLSRKNHAVGKGQRHGHDQAVAPINLYYDSGRELSGTGSYYYMIDVTKPMFVEGQADFDNGLIMTMELDPSTFYGYLIGNVADEFLYPDAVDAHIHAGQAYDFYRDTFGRNSFDDNGATVTSVVYFHTDAGPLLDNAAWISGLNIMVYGVANEWDCIPCAGDIAIHEFTHAVVDEVAKLEYRDQPGALHESFADIMAAAFDDENPWQIGEDTGSPLRDMSDPETFNLPAHIDDYWHLPIEKDNGGVHINSSIPNYAAYKMATRIDSELPGLDGRAVLGQIAYRALHYLTPAVADFQNARDAFVDAAEAYAEQLAALGPAEREKLVRIVSESWSEVGIHPDFNIDLDIVSFHVKESVSGVGPEINTVTRSVYFYVPYGTSLSSIKPDITTSARTDYEPKGTLDFRSGSRTITVFHKEDHSVNSVWTIHAVVEPMLQYSTRVFGEAEENDGAIANTIKVALLNDTFAGKVGENLAATGKVAFGNVPAGLTAKATKVSDTEVVLALSGKARAHNQGDSISNLAVSFKDSAFASFLAKQVTNANVPLRVNFRGGQTGPAGGFFGGPMGPVGPGPVAHDVNDSDDGAVISLPRLQPQTDSEGRSTVAVALEEKTLADGFALLADHPDKPKNVIIPIGEQADVYAVSFPASAIRRGQQAAGEASLVIRAGNVAYELPIAGFDSATLAGNASLSVSISRVIGETRQALADRAAETRMQVIGDAYDFRIAVTRDGKETEISRLTKPLIRKVTLEGRHTNQTAVVRFDPDRGRFAYVPALFSYADGKTTVTFARNSNSIYAIVRYTPIFADVAGHWAKADIEQLAMRQIVSGVTADAFQPNAQVTRAQFAAMLVNALELEPSASETPFGDVPASAWYAAPVAIGVEKGLFSGFADGTFRPNETITREQMAVMLTNAMAHAGLAETRVGETESWLARFTDREAISGWSAESVAAAVRAGLLFGRDDGRFAPADPATRAEAAAIVMRLLNQLEQ